jgi:hypothetical protein
MTGRPEETDTGTDRDNEKERSDEQVLDDLGDVDPGGDLGDVQPGDERVRQPKTGTESDQGDTRHRGE